MSRYVLTSEAQDDLRTIREYLIREGGTRTARYVLARFVAAFRSLSITPGKGHSREDLVTHENLRFWPVFSYLIVYRFRTCPLAVVAVLHGKRDVEKVLGKRTLPN